MKSLTAETLKVIPINKELLEQSVNSMMPKKDGTTYFLNEKIALVPDVNIATDNECIYEILEDDKIEFEVFAKTKTDTGYQMSLIPDRFISCTLDELKNDFSLPELSLKEFMKGRYDYNPRIIGNTRDFLKDVNSRIKTLTA